ncbi:MAG TPA: DUF1003 domain-containing protein [Actinocrinis sp.]|jgi:uncharacterized membrane protein|uniref:DUF1003 domain-containing protein n=1 Tax=Actinocrinis sp. TaxID=1920516 RepID=UPI002DDD6FBD|nr:DUF1003 domain-containing protein [Actinocrinis sp.]HEV3170928.1 DUF1003 domain-containing protein [Actinocrinis sp.]
MSLYTVVRHPRVHLRRHHGPVRLEHEHVGLNGKMAAWITRRIGSMWTVYVCVGVTAGWMLLGSRRLLGFDPYPYPFLLFLGNVVQLLLIFIILLGQQVLGRSSDKRALQTYLDAEAILHDCEQIQNHLIAQDAHLQSCVELDMSERAELTAAAGRLEAPPITADEYVGFNGKLAAWITSKVGTMTAFYAATAFQLGWIVLAQTRVITFDPYPFSFLLFLSSLVQLLLMFVIMVGQQVIGRAADKRALQTYLDAEAVLHACERLQEHLRAQDLAIRHVVEHMEECRVS